MLHFFHACAQPWTTEGRYSPSGVSLKWNGHKSDALILRYIRHSTKSVVMWTAVLFPGYDSHPPVIRHQEIQELFHCSGKAADCLFHLRPKQDRKLKFIFSLGHSLYNKGVHQRTAGTLIEFDAFIPGWLSSTRERCVCVWEPSWFPSRFGLHWPNYHFAIVHGT